MIVLGFDTATQSTAVGLRLTGGETLQARDDPAPGGHPGHATRLLGMAGELLADAGLRWSVLERIAVGVGPGRFTGLRVGIATARGLAQALGSELVGVSSLQALGQAAASSETGAPATIAVIDARRGEAFAGAFSAGSDFGAERRPDGGPLEGEIVFPRPLGPRELRGIRAAVEQAGAPLGQPWRAVGDGAVHFRDELRDGGVDVPEDGSPLHHIDPRAICELGARLTPVGPYEEILPDYRRAPDAALARERSVALKDGRT